MSGNRLLTELYNTATRHDEQLSKMDQRQREDLAVVNNLRIEVEGLSKSVDGIKLTQRITFLVCGLLLTANLAILASVWSRLEELMRLVMRH